MKTLLAAILLYTISYAYLNSFLPKQTESQIRMGTSPPSALFLDPKHPAPVKGEQKIIHAIQSHIASQLVEFADPANTDTPLERIRKIIWSPAGDNVQLSWLQNASRVAPHDWRVKRVEFQWTLMLKGPDEAANCLRLALTDMPKNGLLWLDMAQAAFYSNNIKNKENFLLNAFENRQGWLHWENYDVTHLTVLLQREIQKNQARASFAPENSEFQERTKKLKNAATIAGVEHQRRIIEQVTPQEQRDRAIKKWNDRKNQRTLNAQDHDSP